MDLFKSHEPPKHEWPKEEYETVYDYLRGPGHSWAGARLAAEACWKQIYMNKIRRDPRLLGEEYEKALDEMEEHDKEPDAQCWFVTVNPASWCKPLLYTYQHKLTSVYSWVRGYELIVDKSKKGRKHIHSVIHVSKGKFKSEVIRTIYGSLKEYLISKASIDVKPIFAKNDLKNIRSYIGVRKKFKYKVRFHGDIQSYGIKEDWNALSSEYLRRKEIHAEARVQEENLSQKSNRKRNDDSEDSSVYS